MFQDFILAALHFQIQNLYSLPINTQQATPSPKAETWDFVLQFLCQKSRWSVAEGFPFRFSHETAVGLCAEATVTLRFKGATFKRTRGYKQALRPHELLADNIRFLPPGLLHGELKTWQLSSLTIEWDSISLSLPLSNNPPTHTHNINQVIVLLWHLILEVTPFAIFC